MNFQLMTKTEWFYGWSAFIIGLFILYDYSINDAVPIYIMIPVDIMGILSFYLFIKEKKANVMEKKN